MKKEHILVCGSAVVDLIFKGKVFDSRKIKDRLSLAFGGKYVADEFFQFYGGGGANIAVSLARQGFKVCLWTFVGNDIFGKQAVYNLKKNKVNTKLIRFKADHTMLSSIILTSSGERTIINYRSNADLINLNNKVLKQFKKSSWFVLSSLVKCPKNEKIEFLKEAKRQNLKVFLSLHGSEYLKGYNYLKDYFPYCQILHLNAHELADIFGGNAKDFNYLKTNFAKKLKLPMLLITYDINGSFCHTYDKIYYQKVVKPKQIVDTTGAGDAFAAGFLGEYLRTDSIEKSLIFGSQNASKVIENLGGQNILISKED